MNVSRHARLHDEQQDQSWLFQAHAVVCGGWLGGGILITLGVVSSPFPAITSSLMFFAATVTAEGGLRHYRAWRHVSAALHRAGCLCPAGTGGAALRARHRMSR